MGWPALTVLGTSLEVARPFLGQEEGWAEPDAPG